MCIVLRHFAGGSERPQTAHFQTQALTRNTSTFWYGHYLEKHKNVFHNFTSLDIVNVTDLLTNVVFMHVIVQPKCIHIHTHTTHTNQDYVHDSGICFTDNGIPACYCDDTECLYFCIPIINRLNATHTHTKKCG